MSKASKWYLFYLFYSWQRQKNEIIAKEFDNELDMLVWASKNPHGVGYNTHHVVGSDGLTAIPNDLYERIDVLRRELIEKERTQTEEVKVEQTRAERLEIAAKEHARRQRRKAKQEATCTQPSA